MTFLVPLAEGAGETTAVAGGTEAAAATRAGTAGESGGLLAGANPFGSGNGPAPIGGNKLLIAEFVAAMVLIGVTPLVGGTFDGASWLKRGAACTGLFLVLALISAGGVRASRIAAAFGGLVLLGLLISERTVFGQITALLGATADAAGGDADTEESANITVDDTGE